MNLPGARHWRALPADHRLFLWMMAALIPARIAHTWNIRWPLIDGGYYLDVAKHVRDGQGLASNLSLYHFGYESFPQPTSVYPLWPWMLGMLAKVIPLEPLSHWLPLGWSFVAVAAAYAFGRRLWPEQPFPVHVPGMHLGHLFALALATHTEFVVYTSVPYTEGLAWALWFGFCWRVAARGADLSLGWAVETAAWLSALYFARYQFVVVPLAVAAVAGARLALGPDRWAVARYAGTALGLTAAAMGAWYLHLATFVHDPGLGSLLRFDQNRATDVLAPITVMAETRGLLGWLVDRATGISVAWDPVATTSYWPAFHAWQWALAFALPFLAIDVVRWVRARGLSGAVAALRAPEAQRWLLVGVLAFAALLSVHVIHKQYNGSWYFAKRQGLPSLMAFVLSAGWLLHAAHHHLARVLGVIVVSGSLVLGVHTVWGEVAKDTGELRGPDRHGALVAWLQSHARGGSVVVDANLAQRIGWRTEEVGYHWIEGRTTYRDLLALTDTLGARYAVFRPQALTGFDVFLAPELRQDFRKVRGSPSGAVILERCPPMACLDPTQYEPLSIPKRSAKDADEDEEDP
ncbi:MAG: hypothetical protein ABMA64_27340 [Myxococcota bacterium]